MELAGNSQPSSSARKTATYSVDEVAAILGIGRMSAYEAVHRGEIPSVRIGRRILVPKAALSKLLLQPGFGDSAA